MQKLSIKNCLVCITAVSLVITVDFNKNIIVFSQQYRMDSGEIAQIDPELGKCGFFPANSGVQPNLPLQHHSALSSTIW